MKGIAAVIFVLMTFTFAFGDIRLPDSKPTPKLVSKPTAAPTPSTAANPLSEMTIMVSDEVTQPTIMITPSFAQKHFGVARGTKEAKEIGAIENSNSSRTVFAGVLLSLAAIFGGVFMFRNKGFGARAVGSLLFVIATGIAGSITYANVAPPRVLPINRKLFAKEMGRYLTFGRGKVAVKILEEDKADFEIALVVPKTK